MCQCSGERAGFTGAPVHWDDPARDQIEFILKIPRSLDPMIADEINERHRLFVEQEITRFSHALRDAGRLSSKYKPSGGSCEGARQGAAQS